MARRVIKTKDLSGLNIYQDPKRGTIFYDPLTRKGYILTSSDVNTYTMYTAMLPICILAGFGISALLSFNYVTSFVIFIVLYIICAILFRIFFFYKLPVAEKWHPYKKEKIYISMARNFTKGRLIALILMLLALTIMMPMYGKIENFDQNNMIACYLIAAVTLVGTIISTIALITKYKYDY